MADDGRGNERGPRCTVFHEDVDVDAELHRLGLERDELLRVVRLAQWACSQKTVWHPPNYGGLNQYAYGTSGLRKELIENRPAAAKWSMDNSDGFCRTTDPEGRTTIVVASGSAETGDPNRQPRTRHAKGKLSLKAVAVNRLQRSLFDEARSFRDKPTLWFLLIRVDGDEVRSELSLPLGVDETGRAHLWRRRIIVTGPEWPVPPIPDSDDIDIDVVLRAG